MISKIILWTKRLSNEIIVKMIVYFLLLPIGALGNKMLAGYENDYVVMTMLYYAIPLFSSWGMLIFRGEVKTGILKEYMHKDSFVIKYSVAMLLVDIFLVTVVGKILLKSNEDEINNLLGLCIVIFFMTGLASMLVELSRSTSFSAVVLIVYTVLSSSPLALRALEILDSPLKKALLVEIQAHLITDSENLGFIAMGAIFWIIGTVAFYINMEE